MSMLPSDRRIHPRRPFQAKLVFNLEGFEFRGNCQDLSEGGLCFMAGVDIAIGTGLMLYLFLPEGTASTKLTVSGAIRWKLPVEGLGLFRYGVTFLDLSDDERKLLSDFLAGV
jgi:hypothetical protein